MVADLLEIQGPRARWFNYLALSLVLNLVIISLVKLETSSLSIPTPSLLKINLMSLAAPKPQPVKEVTQITNTPTVQKKNIIHEKQAERKLVKTKIKPLAKKEIIPRQIAKTETVIDVVKTKPIIQEKKSIPIVKEEETLKKINYPTRIKTAQIEQAQGKDLSTVIQDAKYRKQTPPIYPRRALELGQQGNITLHALVKPDGLPSELKIKQSSGHSLLDKAALAAVRKWEFEPTNKNGIAVSSWVRVPIEFVIQ